MNGVPVSGIMGKAIIKKNLLGIRNSGGPCFMKSVTFVSRPRSCLGTSRSAWSASRCHAYKSLLKICLRLVCQARSPQLSVNSAWPGVILIPGWPCT